MVDGSWSLHSCKTRHCGNFIRGIKGLSAADYERSHPFGGQASLARLQILSATALNVAETHSHVESHS